MLAAVITNTFSVFLKNMLPLFPILIHRLIQFQCIEPLLFGIWILLVIGNLAHNGRASTYGYSSNNCSLSECIKIWWSYGASTLTRPIHVWPLPVGSPWSDYGVQRNATRSGIIEDRNKKLNFTNKWIVFGKRVHNCRLHSPWWKFTRKTGNMCL